MVDHLHSTTATSAPTPTKQAPATEAVWHGVPLKRNLAKTFKTNQFKKYICFIHIENNMKESSSPSSSSSASCDALSQQQQQQQHHALSTGWTLWCHLPHDTDWSLKSYIKIYDFDTVEQAVSVTEMLPPKLVINCMLFLMRDGITPIWEDARNRNGGCFSYKVSNKDVPDCWRQLSYVLVGNSISPNKTLLPVVNGITISPKKNFCIVKIWLANCKFQNAAVINEVVGITPHGCLFKKHTPEY
jgi:hypothetical protein